MKPMTDVIQRVKTSEEEELQMKSAGDSGRNASADLETSINQSRGGGQSLNDSIRQPMEQAFGADFSGVKVHTDSKSDQLNQSIQAKAFTTGQDIFFRQGEYNPGNKGGQELLAHELTHVVQQSGNVAQAKQEQPQVHSNIQRKTDISVSCNTPLQSNRIIQLMGPKPSFERVKSSSGDEPIFELSEFNEEEFDTTDEESNTQEDYTEMLANYETLDASKKKGFFKRLKDKWKGSDKQEIAMAFKGRGSDISGIVKGTESIKSTLNEAKGIKVEEPGSDSILEKILGKAFAEIIGKIGTGISSIVNAGKSIWSWIGRYKQMKSFKNKLETSDSGLREAVTYSYAKIRRSVWEGFADMVFNVTQSVCRVITVISGGTAVVAPILDAALTIAKAVKKLVHAAKGVYKWIIGTRGVNREISAGQIIGYAASGNEDAIELIYVFKPFKFLDEYHGPKGKTINEKVDAFAETKTRTVTNAGKRLLGKNVSDFLDLRQLDLQTMKVLFPDILKQGPDDYMLKMVAELKSSLTSMSTV